MHGKLPGDPGEERRREKEILLRLPFTLVRGNAPAGSMGLQAQLMNGGGLP